METNGIHAGMLPEFFASRPLPEAITEGSCNCACICRKLIKGHESLSQGTNDVPLYIADN